MGHYKKTLIGYVLTYSYFIQSRYSSHPKTWNKECQILLLSESYHCSFCIEINTGYNILSVLQASLIGHVDKLHLLKPSTIFMEFGAGRGKGIICRNKFNYSVNHFVSKEPFLVAASPCDKVATHVIFTICVSIKAVLFVAIHSSLVVGHYKRCTLRYHCMIVNLQNCIAKNFCREIVSLASVGTGEFCKRCRLSSY